ncbi:MAG: iron ABC transporter permease [Burkholderiaceae bacterium]
MSRTERVAPWLAVLPIVVITAVPVLVVLASLAQPDRAVWSHLWQHVMPELIVNTLWLVLGSPSASTIGVTLAWITGACEFPARRFFSWALMLPLALPAYVTAFVWLGTFDATGALASWLRASTGMSLPPIRSRGGVILVMVLALYPYVYLTARAAFVSQGRSLLEAAQSMGMARWQVFWRVSLPMARPAIAVGMLLAVMETLADFGTVAVFNYDTFTTGIYKAWFALFSLPAAAQLASVLVIIVAIAALLEGRLRTRRDYSTSGRPAAAPGRIVLRGWHAGVAFAWASLVFGLAFVLPVSRVLVWAAEVWARDADQRYLGFAWHSLVLAGMGALLITTLALALAYAERVRPSAAMRASVRLSTLGYALPGTVLAVGVFVPLAWLDNRIIELFGLAAPLIGGTLAAMLLAYCARFLAVAFGPVNAGLIGISRSVDEAAQSLGVVGPRRLWRIHLPLLRSSVLAAAAIGFVELMKELPITLMTRPFGWETLVVRVFEMTSEGEWDRAALPAAAIVVVGLLPVMLLIRSTSHAEA